MRASNPETVILPGLGLNPGPADNRFRLSAHCANEPQRQLLPL